ncbi:ribonuclease P/MRP subunit POP4 [Rhodnius prolixus]|uniref:Ribonuclease P protein subunit p29 n=2 Tax=Rhodnius TaxID=13248 RepID=T1IDK3_RHOPR
METSNPNHLKEKDLLRKLPESVEYSINLKNDDVESFLKRRLPRNNLNEIEQELQKRFPLSKERQVYKKRIRRQGCPKSKQLSNTKKRFLGLYNISKRGLFYQDFIPLNQLWNQYIENLLGLQSSGLDGAFSNCTPEEITQQMLKADFHGAVMEVHKSTCPNLVGINGIVVFETRNVIKLLGKDNITRSVPKQNCEFKLKISNFIITFLGKNLLIRPADRSIKKVRNIKCVEL